MFSRLQATEAALSLLFSCEPVAVSECEPICQGHAQAVACNMHCHVGSLKQGRDYSV
jgi:hypothetical protein